ncbi:MAG: hypothetical protein MZU97_22985 [Bacillus subtilis]|nr:hypothetical protein [Bacillus subtilis]
MFWLAARAGENYEEALAPAVAQPSRSSRDDRDDRRYDDRDRRYDDRRDDRRYDDRRSLVTMTVIAVTMTAGMIAITTEMTGTAALDDRDRRNDRDDRRFPAVVEKKDSSKKLKSGFGIHRFDVWFGRRQPHYVYSSL